MNVTSYKEKYPYDILVFIEEYNKQTGEVLFDFLDSNEYANFCSTLNISYDIAKPSMVMLGGYLGKRIHENTVYSIKSETISSWRNQINDASKQPDSFLIGFFIEAHYDNKDIFKESVSQSFEDFWRLGSYSPGIIDYDRLPVPPGGQFIAVIRNVGQGSYNEVTINDEVKIVFDAGASMNTSKLAIRSIIEDRICHYRNSKPILIISHWDKDHYHSLLGMTDNELSESYSAFIYRGQLQNLTTRVLSQRIRNAIGSANSYAIPFADSIHSEKPVRFFRLTNDGQQIDVYNAQYHKNRNISGLALVVKTKASSIVFPGDAYYEQISRDIISSLNYSNTHYLVVPHHGGKAGRFIYHLPLKAKPNLAIISVGKNRYGHPYQKNIDELKSLGFKIKSTKYVNKDIVIPM